MEKILKVSNFPQGKFYVPGVRIAGQYLQDYNFKLNDSVIVKYKKNRVTIKKATQKDIFNFMAAKNPALISLQTLLK